MIKIITILLLLVGSANGAQQMLKSFPNLSKLDIGGHAVIYYNSSVSKILNRAVEDPNDIEGTIHTIETKIDSMRDERYIIDYSDGPSGDPHFIIHRKEDGRLVKMDFFMGTELIVPGDGYIYVSGEANDYFNKRRKYSLTNGLLKEVIQPYYYVGLRTVNTQPLDLYADTSYTEKVTHIPENSDIEVLIASVKSKFNYDFLIKTSYGLLGWVYLSDQCGTEIVKGICFHGD